MEIYDKNVSTLPIHYTVHYVQILYESLNVATAYMGVCLYSSDLWIGGMELPLVFSIVLSTR